MIRETADIHIRATHPLTSPSVLQEELRLTETGADLVWRSRNSIAEILKGQDQRLLVVIGPCSIHDADAGLEYAQRLLPLTKQYANELSIIMRVYFEKPRTTIGWKGLINDPDLDGSFQINKGLHLARQFLLDVTSLGLPAATEFLDTTFGQYYSDLISLGAIGARTTESQIHRELASGLSMPVGFKNRTDGDIQVAVDAIIAARESHSFPSLTREGAPAIMETTGNPHCFLILRGGSDGPNFQAPAVLDTKSRLQNAGVDPAIMIDCSHANSQKDFRQQPRVISDICRQLDAGEQAIRGVMIESHLIEGNQKVIADQPLTYGQSITDACIGWAQTEQVLEQLAEAVTRRK